MRRACWLGLFTLIGAVWAGLASAQIPKTFSAYSPLVGREVTFLVDLDLPRGAGPFPAVVLMHGCGGVSPAERNWREVFQKRGYATLMLESFQARGWPSSICALSKQQSRDGVLDRSAEAFAAARMLRTLPMIDHDKLVLMGFSHGGTLAIVMANGVSFSNAAKIGQGNSIEPYNAVIADYGYCVTPERESWYFQGEMEKLVSPLLLLNGEKDEVTPPSFCQRYVGNRQAKNPDALKLVALPGAYHAYDNGRPRAQYMGCRYDGRCDVWINFGHNEEAFQLAQRSVEEFLGQHLGR